MNSFNNQCIIDIAEICAKKNVNNVILSVGSRCAPLSLAFLRHPQIKCRTVTDERSAGFIALGLAQQTENTVALVCTSGTAVLNYAPAIAEAFYQKIPLLILTADRPPEWIDQQDNQTIHQKEIYGKHCLKSFELPVDYSHLDSKDYTYRIISEAINLTMHPVKGTVHINIPLREPLYPDVNEFNYSQDIKIINTFPTEKIISENYWKNLLDVWNNSKKKLILVGMNNYNEKLSKYLNDLQQNKNVTVISDITSNIHDDAQVIHHSDMIIGNALKNNLDTLKPDLLITLGGIIVSKNIKQYLRKFKPKEHWHIQESGYISDTFQTLTENIYVAPEYFLKNLLDMQIIKKDTEYFDNWSKFENIEKEKIKNFFENIDFSDFLAVYQILKTLPENSFLHLGNSMPIRYANLISMDIAKKNIKINSNRGTSGIDGTISTAVGASLATDKITTIITGDLGFFYDNNALWNNFLPQNLRIILLNNHGGNIFRILDGSSKLPELEEYFETKNNLNAKNLANSHNIEYTHCKNLKELETNLDDFFQLSEKTKILEIETNSIINTKVLKNFLK